MKSLLWQLLIGYTLIIGVYLISPYSGWVNSFMTGFILMFLAGGVVELFPQLNKFNKANQ